MTNSPLTMAPQGRLLQIRYDRRIPNNHLNKEGKLGDKEIKMDQKQVQGVKSPRAGTKSELPSTKPRSFSWANDTGLQHPTIVVTEHRNAEKRSAPQLLGTLVNEVDHTTIQTITLQDNAESKSLTPNRSPGRVRKYSFSDMQGTNVMNNHLIPHQGSIKAPSKSCEDLRRISRTYFSMANVRDEPKHRTSVYEEKPFYLQPENGTFRRRSWQFGMTHSFDLESVSEQETAQLSEILPPIMLPSIYAQERMKQKTTQNGKKKQYKQGTRKESMSRTRSSSSENLTKNLMDCRYLRIPKTKLSVNNRSEGAGLGL